MILTIQDTTKESTKICKFKDFNQLRRIFKKHKYNKKNKFNQLFNLSLDKKTTDENLIENKTKFHSIIIENKKINKFKELPVIINYNNSKYDYGMMHKRLSELRNIDFIIYGFNNFKKDKNNFTVIVKDSSEELSFFIDEKKCIKDRTRGLISKIGIPGAKIMFNPNEKQSQDKDWIFMPDPFSLGFKSNIINKNNKYCKIPIAIKNFFKINRR